MSIKLHKYSSSCSYKTKSTKSPYGDDLISTVFSFCDFSDNVQKYIKLFELPVCKFKFPPRKFDPENKKQLHCLSVNLPDTKFWDNLSEIRTLFKEHMKDLNVKFDYNDFY